MDLLDLNLIPYKRIDTDVIEPSINQLKMFFEDNYYGFTVSFKKFPLKPNYIYGTPERDELVSNLKTIEDLVRLKIYDLPLLEKKKEGINFFHIEVKVEENKPNFRVVVHAIDIKSYAFHIILPSFSRKTFLGEEITGELKEGYTQIGIASFYLNYPINHSQIKKDTDVQIEFIFEKLIGYYKDYCKEMMKND
jgi:hypothetical protein